VTLNAQVIRAVCSGCLVSAVLPASPPSHTLFPPRARARARTRTLPRDNPTVRLASTASTATATHCTGGRRPRCRGESGRRGWRAQWQSDHGAPPPGAQHARALRVLAHTRATCRWPVLALPTRTLARWHRLSTHCGAAAPCAFALRLLSDIFALIRSVSTRLGTCRAALRRGALP